MEILVTGATGCLGGAVARKLAKSGHHVTGSGRNTSNGAALEKDGIKFANVDLKDHAAMQSLAGLFPVVLHCGGISSAWGRREDFISANVDPTATLINTIQDTDGRLIFVSSPSIFFDFRD